MFRPIRGPTSAGLGERRDGTREAAMLGSVNSPCSRKLNPYHAPMPRNAWLCAPKTLRERETSDDHAKARNPGLSGGPEVRDGPRYRGVPEWKCPAMSGGWVDRRGSA